MREILRGKLFIGNLDDCYTAAPDMAVLHAAKSPCHTAKCGKVKEGHPNYLHFEDGNGLWLNLVDAPVPLFRKESFDAALSWLRRQWVEERKILIHCNKGESRAPSIALLFCAKVLGVITCESYDDAWDEWQAMTGEKYTPSKGIETWLRANWDEIKPERLAPRKESQATIEERIQREGAVDAGPGIALDLGVLASLPPEEAQARLRTALSSLTPEQTVALIQGSPIWHFACFETIEKKDHTFGEPKPNRFQIRVVEAYEWLIANNIPVRLILLKPRQVGCSTISGHICYHHARRFRSDGLIVGDVGKRTQEIWKLFCDYGERDKFTNFWDSKFTFDTEKAVFRYSDGHRGEWTRDTALDAKLGASVARQVIWFSEAARYAKKGVFQDKSVIGNAMRSLYQGAPSLCIAESTAEGSAGWFYETWFGNEEEGTEGAVTLEERKVGKVGNGWVKVFAAWHEFPEYSLQRTLENEKWFQDDHKDFQKYKAREARGIALYGWTPEQIAWRRKAIPQECSGDESQLDQDFPESEVGAFLSSGSPRFDIEGTTRLVVAAKANHSLALCGTLEDNGGRITFLTDSEPWLWVREEPRFGASYLLFWDTMKGKQSKGSKKRDTHAIGILREAYMDDRGNYHNIELVAAIDVPNGNRWDIDIAAKRAARLAKWYGDCPCVVEMNEAGMEAIRDLQLESANIWEREDDDAMNPGKKIGIPGFQTNSKTREQWVSAFAKHIREKSINVDYLPAANQTVTFVRSEDGKAEAAPGCFDDWVAGIGIGLVCRGAATVMLPPRPFTPTAHVADQDPFRRAGIKKSAVS